MLAVLMTPTPVPLIGWILASALTLSVTVTNWMIGLSSAYFRLPLHRFLAVSIGALCLVALLTLAQRTLFPHSASFFSANAITDEWQWTQVAQGNWTPVDNLHSFFLYSIVSPGHAPAHDPPGGITNNGLAWQAFTPIAPAAVLWFVLQAAGVWGFVANRALWPVGAALATFILGQALLHSVYGEITFTYAAHFTPALVALAAGAYFAPSRKIWLVAAALLVVLNSYGNLRRFVEASTAVNATLETRG
jgi:hypothetical protein